MTHSRRQHGASAAPGQRPTLGKVVRRRRGARDGFGGWNRPQPLVSSVDSVSRRLSMNQGRNRSAGWLEDDRKQVESQVVVLRRGELWPLNPRVRGSSPWRRTRRTVGLTCCFARQQQDRWSALTGDLLSVPPEASRAGRSTSSAVVMSATTSPSTRRRLSSRPPAARRTARRCRLIPRWPWRRSWDWRSPRGSRRRPSGSACRPADSFRPSMRSLVLVPRQPAPIRFVAPGEVGAGRAPVRPGRSTARRQDRAGWRASGHPNRARHLATARG